MFQLATAIAFALFVHVSAAAWCANELGFAVRSVTYGLGPILVRMGRWRLALLPFSGQVRLLTLADSEEKPSPQAFELQPAWARSLLALSGPLALFGMGSVMLGAGALPEFRDGFTQLVAGATDPFGHGQRLLYAALAWQAEASLAAVIGAVGCKVAALNLIPHLGSNGTQAILPWLPPGLAGTPRLVRAITMSTLLASVLLGGGWLLALIVFASGS